ncbi:unnamed protein product [Adineta ricciae]|uniref:Protein kinase domain-containing protein n=1 Tax=Adineta ricciae TaxID=249248 RepID=A0A816FMJ3_ADIRI|nr:unnamed protein product [Adineta ricciae]CAF1663465.1 unnamed protein product [Adineta ricciae]
MGTKTSKRINDEDSINTRRNSSFFSSQTVRRSYADWICHSPLISSDIDRLTNEEINHFRKHQQITKNFPNSQTKHQNSPSKNLLRIEQLVESPSNKENSLSTIDFNQLNSLGNFRITLIDQSDLQNAHEIGKGNFGTVYHALYKNKRAVALKTLHSSSQENYSNENLLKLLFEAHIMTQLEHENLLNILGVTFYGENQQLSLVTDYMKNGSLLTYLRKHRNHFYKSSRKEINQKLDHFSQQIFQAMLYLEQRKIIHRDLAARNCLIDHEDHLKVADFGLTKLTDCGLYKGNAKTIFAIRWSSPEVILNMKYSSRSDVWSFGITLWEIYSLGERPFGYFNNQTVKNLLKTSSSNFSQYFPQSQQFGSNEVYTHLILPCLTYNVTLRPSFKDLNERISKILNENK